MRGIVGTSIYCSPEVIDNLYDEKSDEWSCGVLMYILLCGEPPFKGSTEDEIFENVKNYNINYNHENLKNVSKNCIDLIKRLIEPNKRLRITAAQALKHSFFTENLNPMKILTQHKDLSILNRFINMKRFPSILHEVVIAYCCSNFISQEEEKNLKELFRFLDKENKNKLTINDFKIGLKAANINVVDILDNDGNKTIEYQEFLRALCDKSSLFKEKNLKAVFSVIDKDKKGYANVNDIKSFIYGKDKNNFSKEA